MRLDIHLLFRRTPLRVRHSRPPTRPHACAPAVRRTTRRCTITRQSPPAAASGEHCCALFFSSWRENILWARPALTMCFRLASSVKIRVLLIWPRAAAATTAVRACVERVLLNVFEYAFLGYTVLWRSRKTTKESRGNVRENEFMSCINSENKKKKRKNGTPTISVKRSDESCTTISSIRLYVCRNTRTKKLSFFLFAI